MTDQNTEYLRLADELDEIAKWRTILPVRERATFCLAAQALREAAQIDATGGDV